MKRSRCFVLAVLGSLILLFVPADSVSDDTWVITESWTLYGGAEVLLKINTPFPGRVYVRVMSDESDWQVLDRYGRVILEVPGQCVHTINISGYEYPQLDPNTEPALEIKTDGRVTRTLSLTEISSCEKDGNGYSEIDL